MTEQHELVHDVREAAPLATTDPTPMQLLRALIDGASEKGIDPAQLRELMQLQRDWQADRAREAFADAMAEFQGRCPQIVKRRGVSLTGGGRADYKYASLDDIMRIVQPILSDCGVSVSFSASISENGMIDVTCTLRRGIHAEPHTMSVPAPAQMRVNDTQKVGAALSYAKRYALCAALNIQVVDEDTDAVGLGEKVNEKQAATIRDLIQESGADEAGFLEWMKVGRDGRVEDIPASKYNMAVAALKKKMGKRA